MDTRASALADAIRLILVLLVILAFALRLYQLDYQSLWRDEVDAILFARRDLSGLLPLFVRAGHNGPLYYLILHFWIRLVGDTEFSVRFLSLICGVLAVPLMFRLGRRWVGWTGSLVATLLCTTSPYLIWYSQEGKMYALLFLSSLVSTYIYLLALERNRIYLWVSYLVLTAASMYVHLLAVLVLSFHFLLFLVTWPRYRPALKSWLATFVVLSLPYVPLARWEVPLLLSPFTTGHQFYQLHEILTVLLFAFSLNVAPYRGLLPIALFVFLLLAGILLYRRANGRLRPSSLRALLSSRQESTSLSLYLFVPIGSLFLVSLGMPIFTDRYLITVVPAYLLLLACGAVAIRQRSAALAGACLALVLVSNLYVVFLQGHTRIKSDFRSVAEHLKEDGRGDLVMFLIPQGRAVFAYYYGPSFRWAEPPYTDGGMASEDVAAAMEEATAGHDEVWLVVSEEELWDSRGLVRDWFEGHGAILDERSFARVDVYLYSLRPRDGPSHTEV
ncbi:MAG: glycosyltransferase family 39 protein [Anaerolineae bacterium]